MSRHVSLLACLLISAAASAHDARPLAVSLVEQAQGVYQVRLRVPPSVDQANAPALGMPETCRTVKNRDDSFTCTGGLEGQQVAIRYALYNPSLTTVIRFETLEGTVLSAVLPPEKSTWTIPRSATWHSVACDYFALGVRHIWTGLDHLLFVVGLLLLARTPRRIFLAITGFTIAHSITLSLAALGTIRLPVEPTEAAIALSIVFLARELACDRADGLAFRYPMLVASSFGLLHGLGFAAALGEIGLPRGEVASSLLFFNLGVEAGQIAFILPVIGALRYVERWPARAIGAYLIGIPATFWLLERLRAF